MRRYLILVLVLLACPRLYWSNGSDPRCNSSTGLIDVVVNQRPCVYEWQLIQTKKHPIGGLYLYPFTQIEQHTVQREGDGRVSFIKRDLKPIPAQGNHIYVFFEDKESPVVYKFPEEAQKNGIYIKELDVSIAVQKQTCISPNGEKGDAPLRIHTFQSKSKICSHSDD